MSPEWLEFDTAEGTTRTVKVSDDMVARDRRRLEPPLRRWAAARALRNDPGRLDGLLEGADGLPPRHQGPDSLPYEKAAPNDYRWTSDAYEALVKGLMEASLTRQSGILTARVAGPCPRCRHEVNVSQVLDAVTGERSESIDKAADYFLPQTAETEYVTVPAACQCGEPHEGRPEGKTAGCGINFLVDIEMPR